MIKGSHHLPESKAKMRGPRGSRSQEAKDAAAAKNRGRKRTPEQRARISAASTQHLPEVRAKIGAAVRGKVRTPEWRAKISAALKGRKLSKEHRAAISAAMTPGVREKIASQKRGKTPAPAPTLGACAYCGCPGETIDHVIPRGRPGWDDPGNVVIACGTCNRSKKNRTPDEWLAAGLRGS